MTGTLRIGIVAGEASGDILGAALIQSIKAQHTNVVFEGVGGPLMLAQGFNSFFPMERLSVMGIVEPLKRLPELLAIRRSLKERFINDPPALFLGIDSPDFNLNLEAALRRANVLTVHYVSPSVWAWRQGRVKKIFKAVDRVLTLFPFEAQFYQQHNVPVTFVGHPLADQFPVASDEKKAQKEAARVELNLDSADTVVALMPGSRGGEVKMLGKAFIDTARWCLQRQANLKFLIPAANNERYQQLQELLAQESNDLPITLLRGESQTIIMAADAVLMASGTTTLEALLMSRPMVVAYRMAPFSYAIISRLVKLPYISLPNLLAGEKIVPEILQNEVRAEILGPLLMERLGNDKLRDQLTARFAAIHHELRKNASDHASEVLLGMIASRRLQSGS